MLRIIIKGMITLFDETFGKYYRIIHELICKCVENGMVSEKDARDIISKNAFSNETEWMILESIKQGKWSVIEYDEESEGLITPFVKKPASVPLTDVERRWAKSLLDDSKAVLFEIDGENLEDVSALFNRDDYRVFDKASDPDPYENKEYQNRFKLICDAISMGLAVRVIFETQTKEELCVNVIPKYLEYSGKDDKFRLICVDGNEQRIINMGRIKSCEYCSGQDVKDYSTEIIPEKRKCGLEVTNIMNALERLSTHFSHYRKTKINKIDEDNYYYEFEFDADVESEVVMKIISFGSAVKAVKPESVVSKIRTRLSKQDLDIFV